MTHPDPVQTTQQPYVDDPDFTLYVGDALNVLRGLPDESVHCVVTSPPYWGLRDYGSDGQLGLEPTPEEYVAAMVGVFAEVRRVLRSDGTCWLNIGDSYAGQRTYQVPQTIGAKGHDFGRANSGMTVSRRRDDALIPRTDKAIEGLKAKDLVGIPWRLAFALQADGWYLRSEIIWAKKNCMPESVTDRPTKSHEQVFLLTRSPRYYFDQESIREPHTPDGRTKTIHAHAVDNSHENYANLGTDQERWPNGGRNARSVWEIATQPYAEAHFATFPEELPRRCIAAGTSEHGCCPVCEAPWERVVEVESSWRSRSENGAIRGNLAPEGLVGAGTQRAVHGSGVSHDLGSRSRKDLGWRPTCGCGEWAEEFARHSLPPTPCTVLDLFMGSGTVALVARKLGRRSVGIELNPEYAQLAARRLQQLSLLA